MLHPGWESVGVSPGWENRTDIFFPSSSLTNLALCRLLRRRSELVTQRFLHRCVTSSERLRRRLCPMVLTGIFRPKLCGNSELSFSVFLIVSNLSADLFRICQCLSSQIENETTRYHNGNVLCSNLAPRSDRPVQFVSLSTFVHCRSKNPASRS